MAEFNLFCWSEEYNDNASFQQARYRVFNKEVGENRYQELLNTIQNILPYAHRTALNDLWDSLTSEQIDQLAAIPEFDRKGFEYITKIKVPTEKLTGKKVGLIIDGKKYTATID